MIETTQNTKIHNAEDTVKGIYLMLICTILLVLITTGFTYRLVVRGHSMDPTLYNGQPMILSRKWLNPTLDIRQGDIIVTEFNNNMLIVKRVIAEPGDTIEISNNRVYVNSKLLNEPYILETMDTAELTPVTLSDDEYFVMGDNRNRSYDSRRFGCINTDDIFGVININSQFTLFAVRIAAFSIYFIIYIYIVRRMPDDNRKRQHI